MDIKNVLTENDFQILSNSLYGESDILRKADLNFDEVNACLISHVLHWIKCFRESHGRDPYITEIMEYSAFIKESLSLSRKGRALEVFKDIMSREVKMKDFKKRKDDAD